MVEKSDVPLSKNKFVRLEEDILGTPHCQMVGKHETK
jgi:hypothetical protein